MNTCVLATNRNQTVWNYVRCLTLNIYLIWLNSVLARLQKQRVKICETLHIIWSISFLKHCLQRSYLLTNAKNFFSNLNFNGNIAKMVWWKRVFLVQRYFDVCRSISLAKNAELCLCGQDFLTPPMGKRPRFRLVFIFWVKA